MASAAIAPAAAPTAAAPQAHSSGSMPLAKTTTAATKQATAPTAEHPLKRVADTHDGSNAGLSAKLPKHAGSSQTPDVPKGASFSNDVREHVRFAQLQQKFDKLSTMDTAFDAEDLDDDALLEAARELAEHSSSLEYCCSGLETLSMQANVYADEQTLVGVVCAEEQETLPSSKLDSLPGRQRIVTFQDECDHSETALWRKTDFEISAWTVAAAYENAALDVQAVWRGRAVRIALADAKVLYNFVTPAPPGYFRRIYGGKNFYDFAFCHRGGIAIPYSFSEVLVNSLSLSTTAPDAPQQAAWNSETGAPADASTSPMKDKRIKGAAARKAMVKKALDALQRAREAEIMAKKRVVVVRGELYYDGSRALKDAEDLDDPHAVPEVDARGVSKQINIRWLWPTITKEMVTTAFQRFGKIKHVRMEMPSWGPKAWDSAGDRYGPGGGVNYLIMHLTFSDKAGAAAAVRGGNGLTFVGADVPRDDRNMAIEVRFASDQSYAYDDDDDHDDALHGYGDNTLDDGVGAEGSEPDYEDDFFGDDDF